MICHTNKAKVAVGVHIQAIEWESAIEGIVKQAGLYPRPTV